jgi:hypothetical protein
LPQGVIECDRLQRVLHSGSHPHPLISISQQGSQVALLGRGHPNLRKAILTEQLQQQACVPPIVLLLPRFLRSDLRRMSYPTLDAQLVQQLQEPLHRAGGFDAYHHWTFQGCVKLPHGIPFVAKALLGELAGFRVHQGYALLSCM